MTDAGQPLSHHRSVAELSDLAVGVLDGRDEPSCSTTLPPVPAARRSSTH